MQKYAPMTIVHRDGGTEASMREDSERGEFYYVSDVDARIAELERALDPRRWTKEQLDAWNHNIPDMHAAFRALRELMER